MSRDLDIVAGALIDRFKALGGEMIVNEKGLQVWITMPGVGHRPRQNDPFLEGMTDGAMRALIGLLDDVVGLKSAVQDHIATWPSARRGRGWQA